MKASVKSNNNNNINKDKTSSQPKRVKITAESLKDGTVLNALILRFLNNRSQENMFAVLTCLKDSCVWLPAVVTMKGADIELLAKENSIAVPVKHSMTVKPQILGTKDGSQYIPIYSRKENMQHESMKGFSSVNLPYVQVLKILDGLEGIDQIVVDPFLNNLVLDDNLIGVSKKLPSHLKK